MAKKAVTPSSKGEVFDLERVRQLIELMKENELSEVDLQSGEQRIKLRRGAEQIAVPMQSFASAPPAQSTAPQPAAAAAPTPASDNALTIKSPMVGTFYAKPNPDAQPYVKVGDTVSPDTVVCMIEAMKNYLDITADVSGRIVAILVENEEPVDVNKPLFKVEPA